MCVCLCLHGVTWYMGYDDSKLVPFMMLHYILHIWDHPLVNGGVNGANSSANGIKKSGMNGMWSKQ